MNCQHDFLVSTRTELEFTRSGIIPHVTSSQSYCVKCGHTEENELEGAA